MDSNPGLGRSPGEENDNPLQYFCLEDSIDRAARPWGRKESDMTERACTHTHTQYIHTRVNLYSRNRKFQLLHV